MEESLRLETEKLVRSWIQYDAPFLRDYLVADVEDPRINVQSILSRHFLIATLFGEKVRELVLHELRFAAAKRPTVFTARLAARSAARPDNTNDLFDRRCRQFFQQSLLVGFCFNKDLFVVFHLALLHNDSPERARAENSK